MTNKYIDYKFEDLLQDDFFVQSWLNPTPQTELFWARLRSEHLIKEKEYRKALFLIKSFHITNQSIPLSEQLALWEKIGKTNAQWQKKRYRLFIIRTAACFILLLGLSMGVLYLTRPSERDNISLVAQKIKPIYNETDNIQLYFSNERKVDIDKQAPSIEYTANGMLKINRQIVDKEQQAETSRGETKGSLIYNQLIVPKGKRSTLILEDSTKLWINSGTRVVYPVKFPSNKREIYVDGEVYIDVMPDKECPFFVKTNHLNIKVLGTAFNVTAYEEDLTHLVVLVRGSVVVDMDNEQSEKLTPNKMLSYTMGKKEIKDVNVKDYILWKEGLYSYHSEKLSTILNRLSRYYGKEIDYDPQAGSLKCSGKLDMLENLEIVLDGLSKTVPIQIRKQNDIYEITYKE